ncbi:urease accessory protein UreE [Halobellus ruber]|uniref:Urease accessory protein UreE n=1 Tax=Halobellus ruber TaxID=2761102 RepID=A0A7J9SGE9_9EURY|nr:urease accessory protein UreE [Halobellus ruber]MBB6646035.1 urease accessory protein UreE [Halobellus ruber]
MLVAERYLGHRDDAEVAARLSNADPHRVVLSDTDRRRSRVRTETQAGADLGIVVAAELGDGDVLETAEGDPVVVELAAVDALVVDFGDSDVPATAALAVGHAAGNRHWDLAVRDGEALFPVPDTRERMREAIEGDLPAGVRTRFESVPPTTFDDGGTPEHAHSHSGGGHEYEHDAAHDHGDHAHSGIPGRSVRSSEDGRDA